LFFPQQTDHIVIVCLVQLALLVGTGPFRHRKFQVVRVLDIGVGDLSLDLVVNRFVLRLEEMVGTSRKRLFG